MTITPSNSLLALALSLALTACGDTGACEGTYESGQTACADGFTKTECKDYGVEKPNDSVWNYRRGKTCDELEYTLACSDDTYSKTSCPSP